jgi:anti-sigma regulatory factor (Ser/Thr protein kinase)
MDLAPKSFTVTSPAKASAARRKVREFAAAIVGPEIAEDVKLMLSEGIANVVSHGRGHPTVTVTCSEKALRVEVHDEGPALQIARRVDHGRGLTIIDELADRWKLVTDDTGTCLSFEVDRKADL